MSKQLTPDDVIESMEEVLKYVPREHHVAAKKALMRLADMVLEAGGQITTNVVDEHIRAGVLTLTSKLN